VRASERTRGATNCQMPGYVKKAHIESAGRTNATWDGDHWRVVRRTLRHPSPEAVRSADTRKRYRTLVFVTAWPVAPVHDTLRTLAWSFVGVSAVMWVVAGIGGRWVCRRALAPVRRMTESAKCIMADDLGWRLHVPFARDELHDLAGAFNGLLTRLQDSFERQRPFTGEASHQLRTPLTAMLGQMEVALRRDREPDECRRVLTTSVVQAARLRRIIEMLLFLARADADARMPGLEEVELTRWLSDLLAESWSGHPRFTDLKVGAPVDGSILILAQPTLLAHAFNNLLDNAVKYSDSGSPICIEIVREPDAVVIVVEDRGRGIATEDIDRVFDPFFRANEVKRAGIGGVGLGLAVTARIVTAFGGGIGVKGRPGGGSRFAARFPCHPVRGNP